MGVTFGPRKLRKLWSTTSLPGVGRRHHESKAAVYRIALNDGRDDVGSVMLAQYARVDRIIRRGGPQLPPYGIEQASTSEEMADG